MFCGDFRASPALYRTGMLFSLMLYLPIVIYRVITVATYSAVSGTALGTGSAGADPSGRSRIFNFAARLMRTGQLPAGGRRSNINSRASRFTRPSRRSRKMRAAVRL